MIGFMIVLAIGVVVLFFSGRSVLLGRKSQGWPSAPGKILYTSPVYKYGDIPEYG